MINSNSTAAVIMAAGRGTRLGCTDIPKVMLAIGGKPMVGYSVETLEKMNFLPERIVLVVGFAKEKVMEYFGSRVSYAIQDPQLGTAHAAYVGMLATPPQATNVLVMGGDDSAFYTPATLEFFIGQHVAAQATVSVLTRDVPDPAQLGRIIRDANGDCVAILEKEQITAAEKNIHEVNTGTYCINRQWFEAMFPTMPKTEGLGEYGLNDTLRIAFRQGHKVQAVKMQNPEEWFGVNTSQELAEAERRKKEIGNKEIKKYFVQ